MNLKNIRRSLSALKQNTAVMSAGIILCIILLILSPRVRHLDNQLYVFGIIGLVLLLAGMRGVLKDSLKSLTPEMVDEDAQNYIVGEHRKCQAGFVISFVVWLSFTMVLIWSLIMFKRMNPIQPLRMMVAYRGFWLSAIVLFPALRKFLYLFFSRKIAGYGKSPRRLKSAAQFLGSSVLYWWFVRGITLFVWDKDIRWEIHVYGLVAYIGVVVIIVLVSKENWNLLPYISMISAVRHRNNPIQYNEDNGIYTIQMNEEGNFRILQLTDIHLGGSLLSSSKDEDALEAVYQIISKTKPDLIVVTGDLVFPVGIQSFSINNYAPMVQFVSFMRNIGIPWAFTFGNHDTEFMASHSESEIKHLFERFSYKNTFNLLYDDSHARISGRANQMLKILNPDGSINQLLFLLDSNAYIGKNFAKYDYIHDDQVEWYEKMLLQEQETAGRNISSLLFFHMPLQEFREAYDLLKEDDPAVTYYYGKVGEKNESICCSAYRSKLFDTAVRLRSTKGMFIGHDHYNNISMEYKGIRLTYGLSIDYLAMPGIHRKTEQRGGTLITLHDHSRVQIEPVYLKDISY